MPTLQLPSTVFIERTTHTLSLSASVNTIQPSRSLPCVCVIVFVLAEMAFFVLGFGAGQSLQGAMIRDKD